MLDRDSQDGLEATSRHLLQHERHEYLDFVFEFLLYILYKIYQYGEIQYINFSYISKTGK